MTRTGIKERLTFLRTGTRVSITDDQEAKIWATYCDLILGHVNSAFSDVCISPEVDLVLPSRWHTGWPSIFCPTTVISHKIISCGIVPGYIGIQNDYYLQDFRLLSYNSLGFILSAKNTLLRAEDSSLPALFKSIFNPTSRGVCCKSCWMFPAASRTFQRG